MFNKDFKEILSIEIVSMTGGLFAGFLLAFITNKLEVIPGLLLLLPGFLEIRGSISGSLSARISSALFLKVLKPTISKQRILYGNITAAVAMGIILSLILGVMAFLLSFFVFQINYPNIILMSLIAGVLATIIEIPLTLSATFWLFKRGHDPNNVMGPYITTVGDIVSVLSIMFAMVII
ncbi:MAG: magnesium transporter [Candidatus Aenigmarchaeota archaeon]|nr:magnesium transporter [Candidatus Aenigmarchaeota archaeon]